MFPLMNATLDIANATENISGDISYYIFVINFVLNRYHTQSSIGACAAKKHARLGNYRQANGSSEAATESQASIKKKHYLVGNKEKKNSFMDLRL